MLQALTLLIWLSAFPAWSRVAVSFHWWPCIPTHNHIQYNIHSRLTITYVDFQLIRILSSVLMVAQNVTPTIRTVYWLYCLQITEGLVRSIIIAQFTHMYKSQIL